LAVNNNERGCETATLAGGCFWCIEAVFDRLRGVKDVIPGYAGGETSNPTYEQICTGRTGHAEVINIVFDPDGISYRDLLEVFFAVHDPTALNRQGADVGTQYRSAIFYHTPKQKETAERVIADLNQEGIWDDPIVTELAPLEDFYEAEDYHRDYFDRNPNQPYCRVTITPKLSKLRERFSDKLR